MNSKLYLALFLGFIIPLIIGVYITLYYLTSFLGLPILIINIILIVSFLKSFKRQNKKSYLWYVPQIFGITYLLVESVTFILLGFGIIRSDLQFFFRGFDATSAPLAVYDTISGYRISPESQKYMFIADGQVIIEHPLQVNDSGWFSKHNYTYAKQKARKKRYMVLGDSFSAGIIVKTTWVDKLQQLLVNNGNDSIEFYNFSVDGSGIQNWHRIFFKEILPNYEFDGIIIAPSSEAKGIPNFDRKFFIAQSSQTATYIAYHDITESPLPADFPLQKAIPAFSVNNEVTMQELKARYVRQDKKFCFKRPSFDLHFLSILCGVTDGIYRFTIYSKGFTAYSKSHQTYSNLATKPYSIAFFENRYKYGFMLKEIIHYCNANQKEVILVSIPDLHNALQIRAGKPCIYRNEHLFLAEYFHLQYFDGYKIFDNQDSTFIDQCYYKYDQHWNDKGTQLFAEELAKSELFQ